MRLFIVETDNIAELVLIMESLMRGEPPPNFGAPREERGAPPASAGLDAPNPYSTQGAPYSTQGAPKAHAAGSHADKYPAPDPYPTLTRALSGAPLIKPDLDVWNEPKSWDGEPPFNPESVRNIGEPTTHRHPLYQEGLNAWYGLLHTWNTNFGIEGEPQPDRAKALMDMLNFGGQAPWIYIRAFPGLTQAIFALVPYWGKKRVRQVTENIVQVASALAYREFADHLEYTTPYVNWCRLPDDADPAAE